MRLARFASMREGFAWLLRFSADGVLALMLATALFSVSQSYDVWNYHLPFAARAVGLVSARQFLFDAENTERYKGFPLLSEAIQGVLWRLTGRPQCANLVSFSSVPLFALFLRQRFDAPWHVSVLALLAIPLVHTHAVDSHVDLPASAATAAFVLIAIRAYAERQPLGIAWLALAFSSATFAVNSKAIAGPILAIGFVLLGGRLLWLSERLPGPARSRYRVTLAAFALLLPIVFATPLKNLVRFHNPVYPFQARIMGYQLPGSEEEYESAPVYLANASRPVRFALSVLEVGVRPYSDSERWTLGQNTPPNHPGLRMGGFFGAYAVLNLVLLGIRLVRERSREVVAAASGFAIITLIASVLPQSNELRYHLYWMIVLVGINLWLAARPNASIMGSLGFGAVALVTLGIVSGVTRGVSLTPRAETFAQLIARRAPPAAIASIADGETVCVVHRPYDLLWAAPFHPPRRYRIQAAFEARACNGVRLVDAVRRRPRLREPQKQ